MRLPFGKNNHGLKSEPFKPSEVELELVQPFLENRKIPFMEAKANILGNESVPQERREKLSEWVRDQRINNPIGKERQ